MLLAAFLLAMSVAIFHVPRTAAALMGEEARQKLISHQLRGGSGKKEATDFEILAKTQ